MSELNERRWAVASERGREGARLTYAEAVELERSLKGEWVSGLCVITDEAAARLPEAKRKDEAAKREPAESGRRRPARERAGAK